MDQIIDEAEELAKNQILNDPTDNQIVDCISEIVGINLSPTGDWARMAIAAYNRYELENRFLVEA